NRRQATHGRGSGCPVRNLAPTATSSSGPLPTGWVGRSRASVSTTAQQPLCHASRAPRPNHRIAPAAHCARTRRWPGYDRLASRTRATSRPVDLDDPPHPAHRGTDHTRTTQTAEILLHPLRSGATQRDLAV